jgi:hypothetical protein
MKRRHPFKDSIRQWGERVKRERGERKINRIKEKRIRCSHWRKEGAQESNLAASETM